ncbi:hypothetical protein D3C80_1128150 [compost metagenome]
MRALVLVVHGEGKVFHIQRNAVAEDHHHEHRPQQGEGQAYLVAQQLLALTAGHRQQAAQAEALAQRRSGRSCLLQHGVVRGWRRELLGLLQATHERVLQSVTLVLALQGIGCVAGQYPPGMHQRDAVAALGFVHEVGGEENGHALFA